MLGALVGDVAGSYFAEHKTFSRRVELIHDEAAFTQNTLLADALCELYYYTDKPAQTRIEHFFRAREVAGEYKKYALRFTEKLGGVELAWAKQAGMTREVNITAAAAVAALPCAYAFDEPDVIFAQVQLACKYLFNSDTARDCAKAAAAGVYLLRHGCEKEDLAAAASELSGFALEGDLGELADKMTTECTPQDVISAGFAAFASADSFELAVKRACTLGTYPHISAALAGAFGEIYYGGVPENLLHFAREKTDPTVLRPIERFSEKYAARLIAE